MDTNSTTEPFDQTISSIARSAGVIPETVRSYVAAKLIDSIVLPNGMRLLRPSAAAKVRELKEAGLARRGRRKAA